MLMCEIKLEEFQKQNEYSLLYEISVFNSLPIKQYFPIGESSSIKAMSKNKMDEQFKELELLNGELLNAVNSSSLDMKYIMELINKGSCNRK